MLGKDVKMKDFTNCIKAFLERHMAPSAFVEMVDDLGHNTDFYSLQKDKFPPVKFTSKVERWNISVAPDILLSHFTKQPAKLRG